MARITASGTSVTVEGDLLRSDCADLGGALGGLREAGALRGTVDLSRASSAEPAPVGVLFCAWLEMLRRGSPPYIEAPERVWRMLGQAAVDHGLLRQPAPGGSPGTP